MSYPTGVKIYIDDVDQTEWMFGSETITLSDIENEFSDIDITSLVQDKGKHKIEITCTAGVGRVEARVEIG